MALLLVGVPDRRVHLVPDVVLLSLENRTTQVEVGRVVVREALVREGWRPEDHPMTDFLYKDGTVIMMANGTRGTMFWYSRSKKVVVVPVPVHHRFWALGGPNGTLGFPTLPPNCVTPYCPDGVGNVYPFQYGMLVRTGNDWDVIDVISPIFRIALRRGHELRLPLRPAQDLPLRAGWKYQAFEGGMVFTNEEGSEVVYT